MVKIDQTLFGDKTGIVLALVLEYVLCGQVALRAGAWIETNPVVIILLQVSAPSFCGGAFLKGKDHEHICED